MTEDASKPEKPDSWSNTQKAELSQEPVDELGSFTERLTLRAYARSWLPTKLPSLKASTRHHYVDVLDNYVLPVLGDHDVRTITREDLVKWRDSMQVAPATANNRVRVLKAFAGGHREWALRPEPNPWLAGASGGQDEEEHHGLRARSSSRCGQAACASVVPVVHSGLQFSEVSALQWGDIDEAGGVMRVNRAQVKGKIDLLKADEVRTVPLSEQMFAALQQHRERQRKSTLKRLKRQRVPNLHELLAAETSGWVFPSSRGRDNRTLMHNTATRKPLLLCATKAGIDPGFSNDWFRHTFNSITRMRVVVPESIAVPDPVSIARGRGRRDRRPHLAASTRRRTR